VEGRARVGARVADALPFLKEAKKVLAVAIADSEEETLKISSPTSRSRASCAGTRSRRR